MKKTKTKTKKNTHLSSTAHGDDAHLQMSNAPLAGVFSPINFVRFRYLSPLFPLFRMQNAREKQKIEIKWDEEERRRLIKLRKNAINLLRDSVCIYKSTLAAFSYAEAGWSHAFCMCSFHIIILFMRAEARALYRLFRVRQPHSVIVCRSFIPMNVLLW